MPERAPYAASGAYIDRMSDFCRGCAYDVRQRRGPAACPFNRLYWAFLLRHRDRLSGNPRLAQVMLQMGLLDRDQVAKLQQVQKDLVEKQRDPTSASAADQHHHEENQDDSWPSSPLTLR